MQTLGIALRFYYRQFASILMERNSRRNLGTMPEKMSGLRLKPLSLAGTCACRRVLRHKYAPFGNPSGQLDYALAYLTLQDVRVCIVPDPAST